MFERLSYRKQNTQRVQVIKMWFSSQDQEKLEKGTLNHCKGVPYTRVNWNGSAGRLLGAL